ncbi:MAG: DUF4912 domain-containing protein, partial [Nitrospira sp.]|nr:DUF4912 domain-containing protein [Nitrospira sp.]
RVSGKQRSRRKDSMETFTRQELLKLAKVHSIRGRYRMIKTELVRLLRPLVSIPKKQISVPTEKPVDRFTTCQHYQELPESYGVTELFLLTVDPFWIFSYWEVTPQAISDLMNRLGPRASRGGYVLRIYDVTAIEFNGSNAHSSFDLPVDLWVRSWYINLWSSEKSLVSDLGYLLPNGQFFLLVRSNVVQTPRAGVSIFTEARWSEPFNEHGRLHLHSEEPFHTPVTGHPVTGSTLWEKFIEESSVFSSGPGQPFSLFHPRTLSGKEKPK